MTTGASGSSDGPPTSREPEGAPAAGRVRTVLGDVDPGALGRTDYHEHLFQASPLLPGEDLDDEECSGREAALLRDSGFEAMVEATPVGLGRAPEALARISTLRCLTIVQATGAHREEHYPEEHWLRRLDVAGLAARFRTDLLDALPARDGPGPVRRAEHPHGGVVRAGLLKAGIGYWSIGAFESRVLRAVAEAHAATGAPVMVHLEHGSAALEVLDRLAGLGVPAHRVALAHVDRNPDPGLHAELAAAGAYLGYDGAARSQRWPDSVLVDCLTATVERGGGDRVLLGGDVARRSRYVAYGGLPGMAYLGDRFVPRVRERLGEEATDRVLRANAASWLAWRPT